MSEFKKYHLNILITKWVSNHTDREIHNIWSAFMLPVTDPTQHPVKEISEVPGFLSTSNENNLSQHPTSPVWNWDRNFLRVKDSDLNINSTDCQLLVICTLERSKCLFHKVCCLDNYTMQRIKLFNKDLWRNVPTLNTLTTIRIECSLPLLCTCGIWDGKLEGGNITVIRVLSSLAYYKPKPLLLQQFQKNKQTNKNKAMSH